MLFCNWQTRPKLLRQLWIFQMLNGIILLWVKCSKFFGTFKDRQWRRANNSGRHLLTANIRLHNKGQQHLPALLLGSASPEPLTSSPLTLGGVNSVWHSPNTAHQYLPNIALCPPGVTGTALNRPRLLRRSGHQCSRLLRILLFSQTFTTNGTGCTPAGSARQIVDGNAPLLKCQGDDFQGSELRMN